MKCLIKNCLNYCQIAYYANILLEIDNLNALVVVEFEGWGGGAFLSMFIVVTTLKMVKQYFLLSHLFLEFIYPPINEEKV